MSDRYQNVRKYTDRLAAQFLELVARGVPIVHAADAIGVTEPCIRQWRKARPGFEQSYLDARQKADTLALPTGPAVRQWERKIVAARAPLVTASPVH